MVTRLGACRRAPGLGRLGPGRFGDRGMVGGTGGWVKSGGGWGGVGFRGLETQKNCGAKRNVFGVKKITKKSKKNETSGCMADKYRQEGPGERHRRGPAF